MKKFGRKQGVLNFIPIILVLFVFTSFPALQARTTPLTGSPSTVLDEHPWDILSWAVRIVVLAWIEDYVYLLVWFDLDEPPMLFQVRRDYFEQSEYSKNQPTRKNYESIKE